MRTVLFLCTGNYFRSRFSELWFNHQIVLQGHDDDLLPLEQGVVRASPADPLS